MMLTQSFSQSPQFWEDSQHPKSFLSELLTSWNISQINRIHLHKYYILFWDTAHLLTHMRHTSSGTSVFHQGVEYAIILHGITFEELRASRRISLSFRKIKLDDSGYVLVRIAA